jgi:cobalt-zinc-cadmium efflux system outer membrane protein
MARRTLQATFLIFIAGMGLGGAETPRPLTLASALELADKQNLDLAAARRRRSIALAGIQIARQRPNPTANFSALRDSPHEALFFTQPLELGSKRQRRIDLAQQEGALTEADIAALGRQVRRSIREAYFTALLAHEETLRLSRVLQLAQRLEEIARQRFEAGDVAQLEVIQAELGASRAEADRQVAQQRERVAMAQVNALLNEPPATEWELSSHLSDLPSVLSLADLQERARQANPELQRLAQEQKIEQSRRALLKAERIPNLDLEFGTDLNAPPDFRAGPRGQVSMELPLFKRNQGEIAQSLASQSVLEGELAATARAVNGRVEAGYFGLQAQQTQVELYRDKLMPVARQLEGLAEESYRAGKVGILAVVEAQRNVQDTESSYLDSLFALQSQFAALEEMVGVPLD